MANKKNLRVVVEALTSFGSVVELFNDDFEEDRARAMMAAAMADDEAVDLDETEGSIQVSLYNDALNDDDLELMETDFVQFPHELAVNALHFHFGWNMSFLLEALSKRRIRRLIEEHKRLRVAASSRDHEHLYDLMSQLNMVDAIDRSSFH